MEQRTTGHIILCVLAFVYEELGLIARQQLIAKCLQSIQLGSCHEAGATGLWAAIFVGRYPLQLTEHLSNAVFAIGGPWHWVQCAALRSNNHAAPFHLQHFCVRNYLWSRSHSIYNCNKQPNRLAPHTEFENRAIRMLRFTRTFKKWHVAGFLEMPCQNVVTKSLVILAIQIRSQVLSAIKTIHLKKFRVFSSEGVNKAGANILRSVWRESLTIKNCLF